MTGSPTQAAAALEILTRLREQVARVVVGQDSVIEQSLTAFVARGHVLLEGVPGTAKTLLVRTIAEALGIRFGRIQFTPDLMPADITGISIIRDPRQGFEFQQGPIFTDLLLADEINRAPAKTQAALLEAMAERQVTADGISRPLGELFTTFATQNPVEYEGTYPLPEAQLDRFLMKVNVPYLELEAELQMLALYSDGFDAERASDDAPVAIVTADECRELRAAADAVTVAPEVREYIASIVRATRNDSRFLLGASPRGSVALFRTARAAALQSGRNYATPDDVKNYAIPVLRHRLRLAPELEVEGRSADDILNELLARIPAPR